jgi:hypothetical protein
MSWIYPPWKPDPDSIFYVDPNPESEFGALHGALEGIIAIFICTNYASESLQPAGQK